MLRIALLLLVALSGAMAACTGSGCTGSSSSSSTGSAGSGATTSSGSVSSSVKCSATASSTAISIAKSAHVSAVAEAFAYGCNNPWKVKDFERVYLKKDAIAFAQAITSVLAQCESKGNAWGCSLAKANARAVASSCASAHASAVAAALKDCPCYDASYVCDSDCTGGYVDDAAFAGAFGEAWNYVELCAQAETTSAAAVCVAGTAKAKASAYSNCFATAYAKIMAYATAKALVLGGCYSDASSSLSFADIVAETQIDYKTNAVCVVNSQSYYIGAAFAVKGTKQGASSGVDAS